MQPCLTQHNGSVQPAPWLVAFHAPVIRCTIEEMLLPREYIALRSTCTALHDVMTVVFGLTSAAPEPDQPPPLDNSVYLEYDRLVVGAAPHPNKMAPLWWLVLNVDAWYRWATTPGRVLPLTQPQVPPIRYRVRAALLPAHKLLSMVRPWEEVPNVPFNVSIVPSKIPKDADALGPVEITYRHRQCNLPRHLKRLSLIFHLSKTNYLFCYSILHRTRQCRLEQIFEWIRNRRASGPVFVPASVTHLEIHATVAMGDGLTFPNWHAVSALRTLVLRGCYPNWTRVTNLPDCIETLELIGWLNPRIVLPARLQRLIIGNYDGNTDVPASWPASLVFFEAHIARALPPVPTLRTIIIKSWYGPTLESTHFPPALEVFDMHIETPMGAPLCAPSDLPASLLVLRLTACQRRVTPMLDWTAPRFPPRLVMSSVDCHFAAWDCLPPSVRVLCFSGLPHQAFWTSPVIAQLTGGLVYNETPCTFPPQTPRNVPHPWWGHLAEFAEERDEERTFRFPTTFVPPQPTPHMWWGNLYHPWMYLRIFPRISLRGPHDAEPLEL